MRRKIDNRSVILIILIASFTLLSYVFDQLVIRNEDKLRTQDIRYQNLFTERTKNTQRRIHKGWNDSET